MKYKVIGKQNNSYYCLVCGMKNELGLKADFYELENGELVSVFRANDMHQGYPGRLHGGIASTILDETIGRAIMIKEKDIWGVTIELSVKFRKPVPLDQKLRVVGRITKSTGRGFEGSGELLLEDGTVAVTAVGKYFKVPYEKITEASLDELGWYEILKEDDPEFIELY